MKHKKLFIIMAVVVIMATFTISTFAQVPYDAVTGYYIIYNDWYNDTGVNNSYTAGLMAADSRIQEAIEFIMVGEDYYFIDSIIINDGDYLTVTVSGTGPLSTINIDIIDNGANSTPQNAVIYWSASTVEEARANFTEEVNEVLEVTYEPPVVSNNIYADIYGMVQQYIFGGDELSANQDLVATLTATWSCILLVMLPFIIVWGIFKLFVR